MLSVFLVGASVFTMALFVRVNSSCPLEITVEEIKQVGHRYHLLVEVLNPGDTPIAVLHEEEGFPDVTLTEISNSTPLPSQSVGDRTPHDSTNNAVWSNIPAKNLAKIPITITLEDGAKVVIPEVLWDPDLGVVERITRITAGYLPHNQFFHRLHENLIAVGSAQISVGDLFVPSDQISSFEESPLRALAQKFQRRDPPSGLTGLINRPSYKAIQLYANYEFESVSDAQRKEIEDDAWEIYLAPANTDESVRYCSELYELATSICREVGFTDRDAWQGFE